VADSGRSLLLDVRLTRGLGSSRNVCAQQPPGKRDRKAHQRSCCGELGGMTGRFEKLQWKREGVCNAVKRIERSGSEHHGSAEELHRIEERFIMPELAGVDERRCCCRDSKATKNDLDDGEIRAL
jgi:hypothetical protein